MTVLRSPAYAHHDPAVLDPEGAYTFMDQGIQTFRYSMVVHGGRWEAAGIQRRAALLNQPPEVLFATFHPDGSLPQSDSFISVEPDQMMAVVLKRAEDSDDLIVRVVETYGMPGHAVIRLPKCGRVIEAGFNSGEIKTFRIPHDPASPVVETNLLEEG